MELIQVQSQPAPVLQPNPARAADCDLLSRARVDGLGAEPDELLHLRQRDGIRGLKVLWYFLDGPLGLVDHIPSQNLWVFTVPLHQWRECLVQEGLPRLRAANDARSSTEPDAAFGRRRNIEPME